jgi:hypothetical protein
MDRDNRHRGRPGAERPREQPGEIEDDESVALDDVGPEPAETPPVDDV